MLAHVERTPDVRFGLYLRPSLAMSRAQVEIHDLVARQYGSMTAGRFMPHATIKGFFRSDTAVPAMTAALDPVLLALSPFKVVNGGVMPFGKSGTAVIDAHHLGDRQPNPAMVQLHRDVVGALMPFVHPDCDFTPHESLGDRFHAHLTLMTGDVPKGLEAETLAYLREAEPIGLPAFMAERCHLVAVRSENWHGRWWVNMRWTLLHSWLLGGESQPVAAPAWNTPS